MSNYATQLKLAANCGQDYTLQNPIVMQAYQGFTSYSVMYEAGCLKDTNGSYCFADSITGISPVVDSYLYYLPLGTNLPKTTQPTCSNCVQNLMNIFSKYASQSAQPVSKTYNAAAAQIDGSCGAKWIPSSVKSSFGTPSMKVTYPLLWAMFIGFFLT
jgi:hypothetical protein